MDPRYLWPPFERAFDALTSVDDQYDVLYALRVDCPAPATELQNNSFNGPGESSKAWRNKGFLAGQLLVAHTLWRVA